MCLKKLRKEDPTPFDYDFGGWTEECLKLNREVIEETIKESHARENVIYSRTGSLLALDGVILAVVCTLISRANIVYDSLSAYLLTAGICVLILSVLILGGLLVPPSRRIVCVESCASDPNYQNNCKNTMELQKVITRDRIDVSEDSVTMLNMMFRHLSLAMILSASGLGLIGFSLISSMINYIPAILICTVMTIAVVGFSVLYWKRAKV